MAGELIIPLLVTTAVQLMNGQQVYLSLGSNMITTNNTEVLITDIGEDAYASLTCHTDLTECCRNSDTGGQGGRGEWYYPDGRVVQNNAGSITVGDGFYRVRNAPQVLRLARRDASNALSPTGSYCCVIPTTRGEMTFCAKLIVCPSLYLISNAGTVSYSDPTLGVGSVATYTCDQLTGVVTRTCQHSGLWSGVASTCEISCVLLPQLLNGEVSYSSETLASNHSIIVATYICHQSYILVGDNSRICQSNRTWSSSAPNCAVSCSSLPTTNNGAVSYNKEPSGSLYLKNTVATYACNQGYVLIGESRRLCQTDGKWSSSIAYCADRAMTQLRFGPTDYCLHWNEDQVSLMRRVLRKAIQEAVLTVGNHTLPLEHISEGVFSCYGSKSHTTYRTTITGIEILSADKAVHHLQKWVESGAATQVQWYLVYFDLTCPARISSIGERECGGEV